MEHIRTGCVHSPLYWKTSHILCATFQRGRHTILRTPFVYLKGNTTTWEQSASTCLQSHLLLSGDQSGQRHCGVQSAAQFVLLLLDALTQQTRGLSVSPAKSKCLQDNPRLASLRGAKANPGSCLLETVLLRNSF